MAWCGVACVGLIVEWDDTDKLPQDAHLWEDDWDDDDLEDDFSKQLK